MDLLFRGGTIVTDGLEIQADLGVTGSQITHIGLALEARPDTKILDIHGRYLFPGAVEMLSGVSPFVRDHMAERIQWITGLAAVGGVTSLVSPLRLDPGATLRESLESIRPVAAANAFVDLGMHLAITAFDDRSRALLRDAPNAGIASLWIEKEWNGTWKEDPVSLIWTAAREAGDGFVVIAPLWDRLLDSVSMDPALSDVDEVAPEPSSAATEFGESSFPAWIEAQAVERLAALAGAGVAHVLLRSISSRPALEALKVARERGARLLAAASIAHLTARTDTLPETSAVATDCWPPLHGKADQALLWFLLDEGLIPLATSSRGQGDQLDPTAVAGAGHHPAEALALLWSLLHTEGVIKGRVSLPTLVQALSSDPAKLAGLYPAKGSLLVGSDADIVVFNPDVQWQVGPPAESEPGEAASPEPKPPDGPYTGWTFQGVVEHVYLRGAPLVSDHEMVAEPGRGHLLERRLQIR